MHKKFHKASKLLASERDLDPLRQRLERVQQLLALARQALPEDCARNCLAAVPHGARLHLVVSSPAWGSRLRYFAPPLLQALRNAGWRFDEVRVRVAAPEAAPATPHRPAKAMSRDTAALVDRVADDMPDSELGEALRRLSRTASRDEDD